MRNAFATILLSALLLLPCAARSAQGSAEGVESDLAAILKEMDAMSSELDRIEEITAAPKATGIRIEIRKSGNPPGPASAHLKLKGASEEDREWSRAERESFADGLPLVFQAPVLPGAYAGRIEIAHPSWKSRPSAEFQATAKKGETVLIRLVLTPVPGKTEPALSLTGGK